MASTSADPAKWERHPFRFLRQRWFHFWLLNAAVVVVFLISYEVEENTTVIPAIMLFGALSGAMAFGMFVSDRLALAGTVPFDVVAATILYGGAIGVLFGGLLDPLIIKETTSAEVFWVGPIEETAKLFLPVAIFLSGRYRSARAGLVLGLSSAAGFAILESMGYGYNALTEAGGDLEHAALVPLQRGVFAPFGHLVWTGVASMVLWSEWTRRGKFAITTKVVGVLVAVMALHSLNDYASFNSPDTPAWLLALPAIPIASYLLFKSHARELTPAARINDVPPGWRPRNSDR
jgi:RsiW-degrading membrane proteinase PrsW (M82 family)